MVIYYFQADIAWTSEIIKKKKMQISEIAMLFMKM